MSTGRKLVALLVALGLVAVSILVAAASAQTKTTTLTIESWRNDDPSIWNSKIIPAFEKAHPDIKVVVRADRADRIQRRAQRQARRRHGRRPHHLPSVRRVARALQEGPSRLAERACRAWRTSPTSPSPPGRPTTARRRSACRWPRSSTASSTTRTPSTKLHLPVPKTEDEFFAALDKIKADGTYIPLAMGTKDQWEAATMGYQNIGPNYWKGEEGRLALIDGTQKLTDEPLVEPFADLAKWSPYIGDGFEAQTYPDSQNLFTLGRAAIYPAGSWEIPGFNTQGAVQDGRLPAAGADGQTTCYISDHTDHRARPERQVEEHGRRQDVPAMGRLAGVRRHLRQRAAGLLRLQNEVGGDEGPAGEGVRLLARQCKSTIRSPTRSCRAARRTSRTRPGSRAPT